MSTQVALTFAAIASGLLAGLLLALALVVNLVLRGRSGDVSRMATRTAVTEGVLGGVAALATLGGIVNHLNAPNAFNVIGVALVALALVIVAAAVGLFAASNARQNADEAHLTRWRQSNWGAMAVAAVAFVLIVVALGTLP
jgi:hypothetical protein